MNENKDIHITWIDYTFQGEGFHAGRRALFIRLPFCNLACSFCDTKFDYFTRWTEDDFKSFAQKESCRFAVITGGEPMMHKHAPRVVKILKNLGYYIACETNGNYPILDGIDFVTCSPKRDSEPSYNIHQLTWSKVNEFKYVVDDNFDFSILNRHKNDTCNLSLSPEFGTFHQSLSKIFDYIKENPQWKISLQTHKWMNVP